MIHFYLVSGWLLAVCSSVSLHAYSCVHTYFIVRDDIPLRCLTRIATHALPFATIHQGDSSALLALLVLACIWVGSAAISWVITPF